ncbi:MAG: TetR/AcrR family transcriptional regulator [Anaerolineaceae bacterium]|nr:TetR/AcrR family transcriptional regulator [Anaerolineaceae bacterium]
MTNETYDNILQAAKSLFLRKGYTAASMREIAEEAGIGKATIYHHFQDKETIFTTLISANIGKMHQAYATIEVESEPQRRITVAAEVTMQFLYESADLLQIARREVPTARAEMLNTYSSLFARYTKMLEESIQQGIESGTFRAVDPKEAALVFMTMIQGNFALYYLLGRRLESPEVAASRLLDVYFNGIKAAS